MWAARLSVQIIEIIGSNITTSNYLSKRTQFIRRMGRAYQWTQIDSFMATTSLANQWRFSDLSQIQGRKNRGRQFGDFVDYFKDNYGLDHFHLGNADAKGNVTRTGYIALVYMTTTTAYIVDITQHDASHREP